MTNQKLLMFAVAGLLVPAGQAAAQIKAPATTMIVPHPVNDKAPVSGNPARLRRTDEEQPGAENGTVALFAGNTKGLYFVQSTELPGVNPGDAPRAAPRRMQLAAVPFDLVLEGGQVKAVADASKGKFITTNNGNEYRNANAPVAFAIDGGNAVCVRYNYQPNNDSITYAQCFNAAGQNVLPQTEIFSKNNDDCAMAEVNPQVLPMQGNQQNVVFYAGCNGNGRDDGWMHLTRFTKQANGNYTATKVFDISLAAQEERSRGDCFIGSDPSFTVCGFTQGNTQPQRNGVYLAAVDLAGNYQGANQQQALLWRRQVAGRENIQGKNTYAMRAMIDGIKQLDPATGELVATDMLFWRHNALQGNNNNNRKGGQAVEIKAGVVKFSRQGMSYVTPLTGLAYTELLGIDGTHNLNTFALVGQGTDLKPALLVQNGSHTGGAGQSQVRALVWDQTAGTFTNAGTFSGGYFDRHLYPNYTGNNPGNQGRNQSFSTLVKNPFFGNGSNDQFLVLFATTGKGGNTEAATKLAAYLSVMPVASGAPAPSTGGNTGGNTGGSTGGSTGGEGEGEGEGEGSGSDTTLGGCSTGGSAGLATFLLLGLAAFIRRRR